GRTFVMADMPGLIEGASGGTGLGHQFLRHIERTKVLVHVVDISETDGRDAVEDYKTIRREMAMFNEELLERPEVIALNKVELIDHDEEIINNFIDGIDSESEIVQISAATGENIDEIGRAHV